MEAWGMVQYSADSSYVGIKGKRESSRGARETPYTKRRKRNEEMVRGFVRESRQAV